MIETKHIEKIAWGESDGKEVFLYTLTNSQGSQLQVSTYGAIMVGFKTADKNGDLVQVMLGKDSLADYKNNGCYLGVIAGQVANRIGKGKFSLDGVDYSLATNNGPNFLHGGAKGFDQQVWNVESEVAEKGATSLELSYICMDGEENLPGNVEVKVKFTLTDENEVVLDYTAVTDKNTIINLTSHPYFNLLGEGSVAEHDLQLNCKYYTPVDETSVPTGEILSVEGTPFDFLSTKKIGQDIDSKHEQTVIGIGYDHNLVIDKAEGEFGLIGTAYAAKTGIAMETYTTEPGVQFYSGNWLEGDMGRNQTPHIKRQGFCLEAQHYPDSINKPHFPNTILAPEEEYTQVTVYKFLVK